MDLLVTADAVGAVQEAVFFAVAVVLNLGVDLLFFDLTSTYFETEEGPNEKFGSRAYGYSRDKRGD